MKRSFKYFFDEKETSKSTFYRKIAKLNQNQHAANRANPSINLSSAENSDHDSDSSEIFLETIVKNEPETKPYECKKFDLHAVHFETNSHKKDVTKLDILKKEESDLSDVEFISSNTPTISSVSTPAADEQKPESIPTALKSTCSTNQSREVLIFKELKYLRKGIDEIKELLNKKDVVQVNNANHINSPQKTFVKFTPWRKDLGLPISNTTEIDEFEIKINDPEYFAELIKLFEHGSNPGFTMKKTVELILDQLFSPSISKYFNCTGQYGKLNFKTTRIYQELKGFMMNKFETGDALEIKKLEKCFVGWLKKKSDKLRLDEHRKASSAGTSLAATSPPTANSSGHLASPITPITSPVPQIELVGELETVKKIASRLNGL